MEKSKGTMTDGVYGIIILFWMFAGAAAIIFFVNTTPDHKAPAWAAMLHQISSVVCIAVAVKSGLMKEHGAGYVIPCYLFGPMVLLSYGTWYVIRRKQAI